MPANLAAVLMSYAQHVVWMLSLAGVWLASRSVAIWLVAAALAIAASWMTRGWIGELSGLHSLWSAAVLIAVWRGKPRLRMARGVAVSIALLGLVLYPSALHLVRFDVYALGYFSPLAAGFVALAALAYWAGHSLWAWGIVAAIGLWALGLRHSPNLWDMLLDVPLWISALVVLGRARKAKAA